MRIQFNTRRAYSPCGQPITAIKRDHEVKFRDHARGITGVIPVSGGMMEMGGWDLQEFVMFNYDRGNYTDAHWTEDELEWRELP